MVDEVRSHSGTHNPFLVYAVHPSGPTDSSCLDFRLDPHVEELWEPEAARYVGDELVIERVILITVKP